ncbi:MAG: Cell division protein FtsL [Gammaproteobacteria bacterium]|nr:Cell division protein FtsL [Gammaproteobacteria bacterium]
MRHVVLLCLLAIAAVSSAIAVVVTRHESRTLFVELQALERERDRMNEEWGQLQLEQATWGTHARVEEIAHSKLQMVPPQPKSTVMVSQ